MQELTLLKIGELARKTGVSVRNLRYYSDLGLLKPVKRGDNGYRYYATDASQQVEFIKKAQSLGFTLEQIKQIFDVQNSGEQPCDFVKGLLDSKIKQLELQIKQMTLFKAELENYRDIWRNNSNVPSKNTALCPLIASVPLDSI